ncbi:hypothetical protein C1S70_31105 (plasmid) [Azospirillum argentinense]|uniref:Uncharacterized protein n=1 Tax=Azospirillum argentinense TaxID=2970906 RepID=A0A2K1FR96_9PROT|nr:hypothetical protein [Azospirillum argentinense]PNQ95024.1 hypothetical protein C1S70_31105 [Azospirillum argentinense]
MSIQIGIQNEIVKLLAFVRAQGKAKFAVTPELVEACYDALRRFARDNNLDIEIIAPSQTRVAFFTGGGTFAGAALGYMAAAVPGAIVGAGAGAIVGYASAHVTIRMHPPGPGSQLAILEIA